MSERVTTSIVLYGELDTLDTSSWLGFYQYAKGLVEELNLTPNYLGIAGQSFKTGKITTLKRTQGKLIKSLGDNEEIVSLAIYSLPDDYKTAAFDYDVYICRKKRLGQPHIIATFSNVVFEQVNQDEVISGLKQYIDFRSGQVFVLSNSECPMIYASEANSLKAFKSLKILDDLK